MSQPELSPKEREQIAWLLEQVFAHPLVQPLIKLCENLGTQPYLVGGAVRNALLGRAHINDLDVLIQVPEAAYQELFNKMMRLQADSKHLLEQSHLLLDLTRVDSVVAKISAFDITLNACALGLADRQLLLPLPNTLEHFRNKIAFPTSKSMLVSAPTAALRTVRFASELDLTLAREVKETIRGFPQCVLLGGQDIPCLVFMELVRILTLENVSQDINTLIELRLLPEVLPELVPALQDPSPILARLEHADHCLAELPQNVRTELLTLQSEFLFERENEKSSMISFKSNTQAMVRLLCLFDALVDSYIYMNLNRSCAVFTSTFKRNAIENSIDSLATRVKLSAVCKRTLAQVRTMLCASFDLLQSKPTKDLGAVVEELEQPVCFLVYLIAKLRADQVSSSVLSHSEKLLREIVPSMRQEVR